MSKTSTQNGIAKKIMAYFLSAAIIIGMMPITLLAQEQTYYISDNDIIEHLPGYEREHYGYAEIAPQILGRINIRRPGGQHNIPGRGTAADPFRISTAHQLQWVAYLVNTFDWDNLNTFPNRVFVNGHFRLENDITLTNANFGGWDAANGWMPIGMVGAEFRGTFDGNFHTISGLYISGGIEDSGLFGVIERATIINLGVVDVDMRRRGGPSGGIVGSAWANSNILNSYTTGRIEANSFAGGIVGHLASGTINNAYSTAMVTGTTIGGVNFMGGIAGAIAGNSRITNTYSTGHVLGWHPTSSNIGGIVGARFSGSATVQNNVALNPHVRAVSGHGRVAGGSGISLARNHGLETMGTNGGTNFNATNNRHDRLNGANISMAQALTASFWTTSTEEFTGWDTGVWLIADGQLPTLRRGGTVVDLRERTPEAHIDFIRERLIGLEDGPHTINGVLVTVVDGYVPILEEWMNDTAISIVRVGDGSTLDSEPQLLIIPSRPAAPDVIGIDSTGAWYGGRIAGIHQTMEFYLEGIQSWLNFDMLPNLPGTLVIMRPDGMGGMEIIMLAPGTRHQVRYRAVEDTSFRSEIADVTIGIAEDERLQIDTIVLSGTYNGVIDRNNATITFTIPESAFLPGTRRFQGNITSLGLSTGASTLRFFVYGGWHEPFGQGSLVGFYDGDLVEVVSDQEVVRYTIIIETITTPALPIEIGQIVLDNNLVGVIDQDNGTITFTIDSSLLSGSGRFEGVLTSLQLGDDANTLRFFVYGGWHEPFGQGNLVGFYDGDYVEAVGTQSVRYRIIINVI